MSLSRGAAHRGPITFGDGTVMTTAAAPGGASNAGDTNIASGNAGGAGDIIFSQQRGEVARFTGGSLGIGTATPAYTLDVAGVAHAAILQTNQWYSIGTLGAGGAVTSQPFANWYRNNNGAGDVLMWQSGLDRANNTGNYLLDSWFFARGYQDGSNNVQDVLFLTDYNDTGVGAPIVAFGVGYTPPPSGYRMAVSAPDGSTWGALRLRMGAGTTGPFLSAYDSAGHIYQQVKNDGSLRGVDNAISTLGLAVTDVGSDASQVLTVLGRTTATADIFHVNLVGQAGRWAIVRDGGSDVRAQLVNSGGGTRVSFGSQTTIASLTANGAGDYIILAKMAASPTSPPLLIETSTSGTLFQVGTTGTITLADAANISIGATTGTKLGTTGGAAGAKLGLFGATPVTQPLLATGAGHTVDDVITALQTLGAVRQT